MAFTSFESFACLSRRVWRCSERCFHAFTRSLTSTSVFPRFLLLPPPACLPALALPPACLPALALPPACLPALALPPACLPALALPPACLPALALPPACLSALALPPACLSALALPPACLSALALPPAPARNSFCFCLLAQITCLPPPPTSFHPALPFSGWDFLLFYLHFRLNICSYIQ